MKLFTCVPVLLLAATPAAAHPLVSTAPLGNTKSVTVSYADLNLESESGLTRLDSRLRAASRSVCPDSEPMIRQAVTARCFRIALGNSREAARQMIAARQSGTQLAGASAITVTRP